MPSISTLRRNRDLAGQLLILVLKAGNSEEAWKIYNKWANHEITFKEAKRELTKIVKAIRKRRT